MASIPKSKMLTVEAIFKAEEKRADTGNRGHLGASQIGASCMRQLWYSFHWCTPSEFPGRVMRLFARGHREEDNLSEALRLVGVKVRTVDPSTGEQFNYSDLGGHFGGSCDGVGTGFLEAPVAPHIIEYKTSGDKQFKTLLKNGVEKDKPLHFAQMQLYMHWSGMKRAFYMVVNKNDDNLYSERVKYDKKIALAMIVKARCILSVKSPTDIERVNDDPSFYQCKWCNFAELCHGSDVASVNCRTCVHSTPEDDGQARWSCARLGVDLPIEIQRKGGECPHHRFIPALIPGAEVVDASQEDNWIQYGADGIYFKNGRKGPMSFSSNEIKVGIKTILNEDMNNIRIEFDGEFVA